MRNTGNLANLLSLILILCSGFAFAGENYGHRVVGDPQVSFNGTFLSQPSNPEAVISAENGEYWCRFAIGETGDEVRQLEDFRYYHNDNLLFALDQAPGSDLYISNSGYIAFLDHSYHFGSQLTVNFYSGDGQFLFDQTFMRADLFGFSSAGNKFGVRDASGLRIISLPAKNIHTYPEGTQFCISPDESLVGITSENAVKVYGDGQLLSSINTSISHARGLQISPDNGHVVVIGKKELEAYSLRDRKLLFSSSLTDKMSFRDVKIAGDTILTGVQYRDYEYSKGILRIYDFQGSVISNETKAEKYIKATVPASRPDNPIATYDPIPWPLAPQDSVHTVWNHYEQHMSYGQADWSYLHQGLDLITEIGEPVYAVQDGIVKCVLTLGGESYWRTAISPEQEAGWSNGWLYAHLIHNTIQFGVGDSVHVGDYLGNIIQWTPDWGHIHFAEIRDTGLVWSYNDNQWGITHNPLLSLTPDIDSVPPVIEDVFPWSKFGFCTNETSHYLNPDSLYGDVDIIVKVSDYIGDSPWEQPGFATYYWLIDQATQDTVITPTLGQILNHQYDVFGVDDLVPYAIVIYKRDSTLLPPLWTTEDRDYYQVLTNNNGDSLINLSERQLSWHTNDFPDGWYWLYVKALDAYGNGVIDGQEVQIRNQVVGIDENNLHTPGQLALGQNYPNPFNSSSKISFAMPEAGHVSLILYDLLGRQIRALIDDYREAGRYSIIFKADNLPSGVYYYKLNVNGIGRIKKMTYIR